MLRDMVLHVLAGSKDTLYQLNFLENYSINVFVAVNTALCKTSLHLQEYKVYSTDHLAAFLEPH